MGLMYIGKAQVIIARRKTANCAHGIPMSTRVEVFVLAKSCTVNVTTILSAPS